MHGKVQAAEVSNLSAAWCCAVIEQVHTNNGFLGKPSVSTDIFNLNLLGMNVYM